MSFLLVVTRLVFSKRKTERSFVVLGFGDGNHLGLESSRANPLNHLSIQGNQLAWVYVSYQVAVRQAGKVNVILAIPNRHYRQVMNQVQDQD